MGNPETYTFVCPECAGASTVTDAARAALVEYGCVHCGAPVSPKTFASA